MNERFDFLLRPLSVERGFELACDGMLREPLRFQRLIEGILAAVQIGQGLDAEIRIFNTAGEVAEVLELKRTPGSEMVHS